MRGERGSPINSEGRRSDKRIVSDGRTHGPKLTDDEGGPRRVVVQSPVYRSVLYVSTLRARSDGRYEVYPETRG